jgi:hypothetical protein
MQYLHDNLKMHIVYGGKCNTQIMILIHTICGSPKCNTYMTIKKCNTHIMTLIHTICGSPKCNTCMTI